MSSLVTSRLGRALGPDRFGGKPALVPAEGEVIAVDAATSTATVRISGSTTDVPGVSYLYPYGPTVGDRVLVAMVGPTWTVVGARGLGAKQHARVDSAQTRTSTSYGDLSTVGPTVTITRRVAGKVIVSISCGQSNNTAGQGTAMSFALTGATTLSAADARAAAYTSPNAGQGIHMSLVTDVAVNAGTTTFTAKYRVSGGTGTFEFRELVVEP